MNNLPDTEQTRRRPIANSIGMVILISSTIAAGILLTIGDGGQGMDGFPEFLLGIGIGALGLLLSFIAGIVSLLRKERLTFLAIGLLVLPLGLVTRVVFLNLSQFGRNLPEIQDRHPEVEHPTQRPPGR